MPKKMRDDALGLARLAQGESTPPLLSEKLIAQLQGAVEAAQRRRTAQPAHASDTEKAAPDPSPSSGAS
jgi:hypothetical protein